MLQVNPTISPANFGLRLCACFIDLTMLVILTFLLKIAFPDFSNVWFFKESFASVTLSGTNWVLRRSSLIGLWIIYSIIMDCTTFRGTVGKQIMKIVVSDDNGNRITLLRSVGRNLFKIISYSVAALGFIWILFDSRKMGWHDMIANTLVIKKSPLSKIDRK